METSTKSLNELPALLAYHGITLALDGQEYSEPHEDTALPTPPRMGCSSCDFPHLITGRYCPQCGDDGNA